MGRSPFRRQGGSDVVSSFAGRRAPAHGPRGRARGAALLVPASALGQFQVDGVGHPGDLADFDTRRRRSRLRRHNSTRSPTSAPSPLDGLGTPESLIRYGGFSRKGSRLTRLPGGRSRSSTRTQPVPADSTTGLEVVTGAPLGDNGRVVVFPSRPRAACPSRRRRRFRRARPVGKPDGRWHRSSTLVGSADLARAAELPGRGARRGARRSRRAGLAVEMSAAGSVSGWARWTLPASVTTSSSADRVSRPQAAACAWRSRRSTPTGRRGYRHVVDAETGAILYREGTVESLVDNPSWDVFPAFPEVTRRNAFPYGYPSTDTRETWCWEHAAGCDEAIENAASPLAWDVDPATGLSTNTTIGNNANTKELGLPFPARFRRQARPGLSLPWTTFFTSGGTLPS